MVGIIVLSSRIDPISGQEIVNVSIKSSAFNYLRYSGNSMFEIILLINIIFDKLLLREMFICFKVSKNVSSLC